MKQVKKLVVWSNGKKTVAGLLLFFIIGGFRQIGVLDPDVLNQLEMVAEALVGLGILHKVQKRL